MTHPAEPMSTNIAASPAHGMQRIRRLVIAAALLAGALVVCLILLRPYMADAVPAAAELSDYGAVPDAQLTERNGAPMRLGALRGKVWVANFIFTRCAGSCLVMSSKMESLQDSLARHGDVMLVSFTVDPDNDTPGRLSSYAQGYHARAGKWLFLTGGRDQMQSLARDAFHLGLQEGTDPKEPIIHSKRFVLIDRKGHIRGYYSSEDASAHKKMMADLDILTAENPE